MVHMRPRDGASQLQAQHDPGTQKMSGLVLLYQFCSQYNFFRSRLAMRIPQAALILYRWIQSEISFAKTYMSNPSENTLIGPFWVQEDGVVWLTRLGQYPQRYMVVLKYRIYYGHHSYTHGSKAIKHFVSFSPGYWVSSEKRILVNVFSVQ